MNSIQILERLNDRRSTLMTERGQETMQLLGQSFSPEALTATGLRVARLDAKLDLIDDLKREIGNAR